MVLPKLASSLSLFFLVLSASIYSSGSSHTALPRSLLGLNPSKTDEVGSDSRPISIASDLQGGEKLKGDVIFSSKATSLNSSSSSKASSSSSCEATYGMLPCTDTVIGNILLAGTYGYLMFFAAKWLSEGSELLLAVWDAGVIGGLLLPILGAFPDAILILVSGLGASQVEAQEHVLVGIGLLAGSIVMLLTLLWGSCLILGRCDLEVDQGKITAKDKKLSKPFNLTGTGVETDYQTKLSGRIMILSVLPFIVAQISRIFHTAAARNIPVLVACVLALGGLVAYCIYQVFAPWIQERLRLLAQKKVIRLQMIAKFLQRSGVSQNLVNSKGDLDENVATMIFNAADLDGNGSISYKELGVMLSVSLYRSKDISEEIKNHFMGEFDHNKDHNISREEFLKTMQRWCKDLKLRADDHSIEDRTKRAEDKLNELMKIKDEDGEDEGQKMRLTKAQVIRKAVLLLLGGTILAAVIADPLVDAVHALSKASHIPSFFISFVLLPLASTSSEGVSSILFSRSKTKLNMSLTYSQVYGAVTINSTMGLGIFLALVYGRQLVWKFSSEVLVICLVTVIMGLVASFRQVFPLWMAIASLLLYPLSLALVVILDYVAGWE